MHIFLNIFLFIRFCIASFLVTDLGKGYIICFWDVRAEKTKIGSMMSAALVSTLIGLAASNIGIIPHEAPVYSIVLEFMLPITVPLLLFRADLLRVIQSTWTLLLAFLLGSGIVLS